MRLSHKLGDLFFKYLFRISSFFSILALGAILLFVFIQGAQPFLFSTAGGRGMDAGGIRLVVERIDEVKVNGTVYRDHETFIYIPADAETITVEFSDQESERVLEMALDRTERDPEKQLTFVRDGGGEISSSEAYLFTVQYSGTIAGLDRKVHIILPEPPYDLFSFLWGLEWRPTHNKLYGILPMIMGTILASFGAILLGVPVAILCALFLSEFLSEKPAALIRAGIELLAGIPSVVYGFFGLMVIVPAVKDIFHVPSGNSLFSAVLVLAVMVLPTIISIAETSMRAVPLSHREASLALGASRMQTSWRVVLPHARSGVIAGIILGISRAVGETMAVILVAGNSAQMVRSPLEGVRTLTSTIALEMGYAEGRHAEMLFSIGVVLFIFILILNSIILLIQRQAETK
ncbi:MAG: phosphate ABC transporter permease subunit PstC [Treponema sp.]|jgi:phosphate transport system permease protein|nr:phosphate ABC transporter permease subunit PstC [Treponema sp.]